METTSGQEVLPQSVVLAFAPLHKRAFGLAVGLATGLVLFILTLIYIVRAPGEGANLWLLGQYFRGYRVTVPGAFVGFAWGMFVGFIGGWFLAFVRNRGTLAERGNWRGIAPRVNSLGGSLSPLFPLLRLSRARPRRRIVAE